MRLARHALFDEWETGCEAVEIKYRTEELEEVSYTKGVAFSAIEKEIQQTPAHTVEGILVKLIGWSEYQCPSDSDGVSRFVESALQDAKGICAQNGGQHV